MIYLHDWSGLRQNVIDCVDWDPHHRGEADAESNDFGPFRVVVVGAVFDGLVREAVESKHRLKIEDVLKYEGSNLKPMFVFY
jgi:hypothetical protein